MTPSRVLSRRAAFLLAGAVAFAVYANSIANDFAYDDYGIIAKAERVQDLRRWTELVTEPYWPGAYGRNAGVYRPFTALTYGVDWALWRGSARGFHLVNVLLHTAVTLLLLAFLWPHFRPAAALAGALLFAVHPVHTEAVANVVGRAEILAAAFAFAALIVLGPPGSPSRPHRRTGPGTLAGVGILYALAIWSKEVGIVLPGLLLVADLARGGFAAGVRAYARERGAAYVVLVGVAAATFVVRYTVLGNLASAPPAPAFVPDASFPTRFFTMIRVWPHYARLLVAPFELSADYSPAVILPVREITIEGVLGLLIGVATAGVALHAWRRRPWVAAGIAWIALGLLPVSNLIFVSGVVLAERTLYLPSAGLSLLVAVAAERLGSPRGARLAAVGYAALLVAFSVVAIRRNPDWKDGASIFNSIRRDHPESYLAHAALAGDLVRRGDWEEATRWYDSAYRIWPYSDAIILPMSGHLLRTGEYERAAKVARLGTEMEPKIAAAWQLRAVALYRLGRYADVAALGDSAPPEIRDGRFFAYVVAYAHEAAGTEDAARAWWARVRAPVPSRESWVSLYEIVRLQLERGDTADARETLALAWQAAAGDSTGLGLLERLSREVSGGR
jgi:tetratricopeptide (TPR) repeat protein